MFGRKSRIQKGIESGFKIGDLDEALSDLIDEPLETPADAEAIADALTHVNDLPLANRVAAVQYLCYLMQNVATQEAFDVIRSQALPMLAQRFDELRAEPVEDKDDLLGALKVLAAYYFEPGVAVIANAFTEGFEADSYLWTTVFNSMDEDDPRRVALCEAIGDGWHDGFGTVAYLDFATATSINDHEDARLDRHPFDTAKGHAQLESWLTNSDPDEFSYAHSATATLPFLSDDARSRLMAIAMDHPSQDVQMESAWASAKSGSESGLKMLARFCEDLHTALRAAEYLEELGHADRIPPTLADPDFAALAAMSQWLQHPSELGAPPTTMDIVDKQELYWPPAEERRHVWMIRFTSDTEDETQVYVGTHGGLTTWCFFDQEADKLSMRDLYARQCSWEFYFKAQSEGRGDADLDYSIEDGHQRLSRANPDW